MITVDNSSDETNEMDDENTLWRVPLAGYRNHLSQHDVIYINFAESANESTSYETFISSVKEILQGDLREAFPDVRFRKSGTITQEMLH
ncbi:MAG: hypothetical protein LUH00_10650 [Lachnospiraceae bacterium]|nr:hypothetical protein [Lachnospiraceae bacterium]